MTEPIENQKYMMSILPSALFPRLIVWMKSNNPFSASSPVKNENPVPQPKTIAWAILTETFWALITVLSAGHWYFIIPFILSIGVVLNYLVTWFGQHNLKRYGLIKPFTNSNLPEGHFLNGLPPRLQRAYALSEQSSLRRLDC